MRNRGHDGGLKVGAELKLRRVTKKPFDMDTCRRHRYEDFVFKNIDEE